MRRILPMACASPGRNADPAGPRGCAPGSAAAALAEPARGADQRIADGGRSLALFGGESMPKQAGSGPQRRVSALRPPGLSAERRTVPHRVGARARRSRSPRRSRRGRGRRAGAGARSRAGDVELVEIAARRIERAAGGEQRVQDLLALGGAAVRRDHDAWRGREHSEAHAVAAG